MALLRHGPSTVNQLAAALGLTDNAVRAQLEGLERQGFVHATGTVPGTRRPNVTYGLTPAGEELFARASAPVLKSLLGVLQDRLPEDRAEAVLREAGRRMGAHASPQRPRTMQKRLEQAVALLEQLGGAPKVRREDGRFVIESSGCPFGQLVREVPQACLVAESMLAAAIEAPVRQLCSRGASPRCGFVVDAAG